MHCVRSVENRSRIVEITSRTVHGRYLMRPSPKVNDLILGVLGRAQRKYDVTLYAFVFLSNHFHLMSRSDSVEQTAYFTGYLKANIAKELGREHDWREKFWGRRYHHGVIADKEYDLAKRLRYILENGCKEGLVVSPVDWPGVSSAWAQSKGIEKLTGTWYDRSAQYRAFLRGEKKQFPSKETVRLSPLPFLEGESKRTQREFISELIKGIEDETRQRVRESGKSPMGRKAILRADPHEKPAEFERSPAPAFHASDPKDYRELRERRSARQDAYREAAERLAAGETDVVFPEDCFPPRLPFVKPEPNT